MAVYMCSSFGHCRLCSIEKSTIKYNEFSLHAANYKVAAATSAGASLETARKCDSLNVLATALTTVEKKRLSAAVKTFKGFVRGGGDAARVKYV